MKYYIYTLVDPRTNIPFYLGKGTGDRWKEHLSETENTTYNPHKYYTILQIRAAGFEPVVQFLYYTNEEQHAYEVETNYIKQNGRKGKDADGVLTNLCVESIPPSKLGVKEKLSTRIKKSQSRLELLSTSPMPPKSEETKRKISAALKGRPNIALTGKPSPHGKAELARRAKSGNETQAKNLQELRNDPVKFMEWIDQQSAKAARARAAKVGKPISEASRAKMSAAAIGKAKPIIQCPHCGKVGGVPVMKRFHFDYCKLRTLA